MKSFQKMMPVCLSLLSLLLSGCKDRKAITVYLVAKEAPEAPLPTQAPMQTEIPPTVPSTTSLEPIGTPPTRWEAQPLTAMRQASYLVKGDHGTSAEISLITLRGEAGGLLDNVNRWLSQLGQPAVTAKELKGLITSLPSTHGPISVVDLKGLSEGADASKDGRIIAGIVTGEKGTYFFKMRGNAELVKLQKPDFIRWIGTVPLPASLSQQKPTSSESQMPLVAPAAGPEKPQISWTTPTDWQSLPLSSMRYASFKTGEKNGEAGEVSVTLFPGDGGGDLANVNRWRSQIGLGALAQEDLNPLIEPVACRDAKLQVVDMKGPKGRILAGWSCADGRSWFFKLIGPSNVVDDQKSNFMQFLHSVQFHP